MALDPGWTVRFYDPQDGILRIVRLGQTMADLRHIADRTDSGVAVARPTGEGTPLVLLPCTSDWVPVSQAALAAMAQA